VQCFIIIIIIIVIIITTTAADLSFPPSPFSLFGSNPPPPGEQVWSWF